MVIKHLLTGMILQVVIPIRSFGANGSLAAIVASNLTIRFLSDGVNRNGHPLPSKRRIGYWTQQEHKATNLKKGMTGYTHPKNPEPSLEWD